MHLPKVLAAVRFALLLVSVVALVTSACPPADEGSYTPAEVAQKLQLAWPNCCCIDNNIIVTSYHDEPCEEGTCCGTSNINCETCFVTIERDSVGVHREGPRNKLDGAGYPEYNEVPQRTVDLVCFCGGGGMVCTPRLEQSGILYEFVCEPCT